MRTGEKPVYWGIKSRQMKNLFFLVPTLFLLLFNNACRPAAGDPTANALPASFFKTWKHSFEEDGPDWLAYRPGDFNFPPARGREGFEIKENGEFILHGIAPSDGTIMVKGTWKLSEDKIIHAAFNSEDQEPMSFRIISIEEDLLKISRQ